MKEAGIMENIIQKGREPGLLCPNSPILSLKHAMVTVLRLCGGTEDVIRQLASIGISFKEDSKESEIIQQILSHQYSASKFDNSLSTLTLLRDGISLPGLLFFHTNDITPFRVNFFKTFSLFYFLILMISKKNITGFKITFK